jgi:hypothetical protein
MSNNRIPTATELGEFCRPEAYLLGMLNECLLEGGRPFLGCEYAYFANENRLCKHPSLLRFAAPKAKPAFENSNPKTESGLNEANKQVPAASIPSKISPRNILKEKYPQLLLRIEQMWGSIELHEYFMHSNRQGFPPDVLFALDEIESKHRSVMQAKGKIAGDGQGVHLEK